MARSKHTTRVSPSPIKPLPVLSAQDIQRFWSYLPERPSDGCWLWQGRKGSLHYGMFSQGSPPRIRFSAHRIAFFLFHGYDPGALCVCHACDMPLCCRGDHLFAGTQRQNAQDMVSKNRAATGARHWTGLYPEMIPVGEHTSNAKLTDAQVLEIRQRYAQEKIHQKVLAREYGVTGTAICNIVTGHTWSHLTLDAQAQAHRHGHYTYPDRQVRGEQSGNAKLTETIVLAVRAEYADGSPQVVISKKFGIGRSQINRIVRRLSWTHIE